MARRRGFDARAQALDQVPIATVFKASLAVFVVSTTGDGEVPANMLIFWRFILRRYDGGCLLFNIVFNRFFFITHRKLGKATTKNTSSTNGVSRTRCLSVYLFSTSLSFCIRVKEIALVHIVGISLVGNGRCLSYNPRDTGLVPYPPGTEYSRAPFVMYAS